jgi:tRNA pseudouridine38-40 synthase
MIRIMVGTMVEIGMGRYPAESISEMLAAKDREAAGPTAPPHGLYLQWIKATDASPPPPPETKPEIPKNA